MRVIFRRFFEQGLNVHSFVPLIVDKLAVQKSRLAKRDGLIPLSSLLSKSISFQINEISGGFSISRKAHVHSVMTCVLAQMDRSVLFLGNEFSVNSFCYMIVKYCVFYIINLGTFCYHSLE